MTGQKDQVSKKRDFHVPAYDGLRFFLLLALLEYHYLLHRVPIGEIWQLTYALPCFFVLSGFLITELLLHIQHQPRKQALLKFFARRALRIFPAYYAVLFGAAVIVGIPYFAWYATYLLNFKVYLLTVQGNMFEAMGYFKQWEKNGFHLWTMAIEEQFYLLYPPVLLYTNKKWRTRLLAFGILFCFAVRVYCIATQPKSYYGALLPVPGEYILWGCLFAWLDRENKINFLRGHGALVGAIVLYVGLSPFETDVDRYNHGIMRPSYLMTLYALSLSTLILVLKHNKESWYSKFLSWKPFVSIGKISYGAYLIHLFLNPLVDWVVELFPVLAPFPATPRVFVGPVVSIAAAMLMWVTFEGRANAMKGRVSAYIDRKMSVDGPVTLDPEGKEQHLGEPAQEQECPESSDS